MTPATRSRSWHRPFLAWTGEEGGYAHEHSTKPATLGAALHDSPAGLAAWIGEKVAAWSSTTAGGHTARRLPAG